MTACWTLEQYKELDPIFEALTDGNFDLVEQHLEDGAPLDLKDNLDRTPLHFVIEHIQNPDHRFKFCRLLLDYGYDVNACDVSNRTALHYLAGSVLENTILGDESIVDLFIIKGANVDIKSNLGETPLFKAIIKNKLEIVIKLLESGADLNSCKGESSGMLRHAIRSKNSKMFPLLLKFSSEADYCSVLKFAMETKKQKFIELMFDSGFELNRLNADDSIIISHVLRDLIILRRSRDFELILENGFHTETYNVCIGKSILREVIERFYSSPFYLGLEEGFQMEIYEKFNWMCLILLKQIAIEWLINPNSISLETWQVIGKDNAMFDQFEMYKEQLNNMKTCLVRVNSNVSYFDLLTIKGNAAMDYRDERSLAVLSEEEIKTMFPNFVENFMRIIPKVLFHSKARRKSRDILFEIFQQKVPFVAICKICNFLDIKHILSCLLRDINLETLK